MTTREAVQDVRRALLDPKQVCTRLGLSERMTTQARGVVVCCPAHGERNPSCSVTRGSDGTLRVRCFSCGFTGDAITLVAQVYGLETRGDGFRETLAEAAELGGLLDLASELRGGKASANRERPPPPPPEPEVAYPEVSEVEALWEASGSCSDDTDASGYLVGRRIDPEAVDRLSLARTIGPDQKLPEWARRKGRTWFQSGHRILVRVFDSHGATQSIRAWRIAGEDPAKRVPPANRKHGGLVLANRTGRGMLLGRSKPKRLLVTEGEPDWLLVSMAFPEDAVIGLLSGAWSGEFSSKYAARVPAGTEVVLWTHDDRAGDNYAEEVARSIGERCPVWRAA